MQFHYVLKSNEHTHLVVAPPKPMIRLSLRIGSGSIFYQGKQRELGRGLEQPPKQMTSQRVSLFYFQSPSPTFCLSSLDNVKWTGCGTGAQTS